MLQNVKLGQKKNVKLFFTPLLSAIVSVKSQPTQDHKALHNSSLEKYKSDLSEKNKGDLRKKTPNSEIPSIVFCAFICQKSTWYLVHMAVGDLSLSRTCSHQGAQVT